MLQLLFAVIRCSRGSSVSRASCNEDNLDEPMKNQFQKSRVRITAPTHYHCYKLLDSSLHHFNATIHARYFWWRFNCPKTTFWGLLTHCLIFQLSGNRERRDSNLWLPGEKHKQYLCARLPPLIREILDKEVSKVVNVRAKESCPIVPSRSRWHPDRLRCHPLVPSSRTPRRRNQIRFQSGHLGSWLCLCWVCQSKLNLDSSFTSWANAGCLSC